MGKFLITFITQENLFNMLNEDYMLNWEYVSHNLYIDMSLVFCSVCVYPKWPSDLTSSMIVSSYGSGHRSAAVLLPGFAISW